MDSLSSGILAATITGVTVASYYRSKRKNDKNIADEQAIANARLKEEVAQLNTHIESLQSDNDQFVTELEELKLEKQGLSSQVSSLQSVNDQLTSHVDNLTGLNTELTDSNKSLTANNEQLTSRIDTLVEQNTELADNNRSLTTDNEQLISQNGSLQTANQELADQVSTLQSDKNQLISDNDKLKEANQQLSNNYADLSTQHQEYVDATSSALSSLQNDLETKNSTIESQEENISRQAAKNSALKAVILNGSDGYVTKPVPNIVLDMLHPEDVAILREFDTDFLDDIELESDQSGKLDTNKVYIETDPSDLENITYRIGRVNPDNSITNVQPISEDMLVYSDYGSGSYLNVTKLQPIEINHSAMNHSDLKVVRDYSSGIVTCFKNGDLFVEPVFDEMTLAVKGSSVKVRNVAYDTSIEDLLLVAAREYVKDPGYHELYYRMNSENAVYKFATYPGSGDKLQKLLVKGFLYDPQSTDFHTYPSWVYDFNITKHVVEVKGALRYGLDVDGKR